MATGAATTLGDFWGVTVKDSKPYLANVRTELECCQQLVAFGNTIGMVGGGDGAAGSDGHRGSSVSGISVCGGSRSSRSGHWTSSSQRATGSSGARRNRVTVVAPPSKLGIILANKAVSNGTVVSGVCTSSVLADKVSPGNRIVAIGKT